MNPIRFFTLLCLMAPCIGGMAGAQPAGRLPDNAIYIVADKTLEPALLRLAALYQSTHPQTRLTFLMRNAPVGFDGIVAGVSLFAPIAHEAWDGEADGFKRLKGYRPTDVHLGRVGYAELGRTNPPAIYVHKDNPLLQLSMADLGRIFTTGQSSGDVRRWSQLGVGAQWANHAIHVYGTRDDGYNLTTLRSSHFKARPFAKHYEALQDDTDVLEAISGDRYGIGLAWSAEARAVPANVRLLPLALCATGPASTGKYGEVREGRYPLSLLFHVYVDRAPGQTMDPVAQGFLRLALSEAGQHVLDELKAVGAGFVPLTADEIRQELKKLD